MHARSTFTTMLVLAMVATAPSAIIRAAGPTVTVEDLGPSGFETHGRSVNASGLAAGLGTDSNTGLTFGFTQPPFALVPAPADDASLQALGINDSGVVVGSYTLSGGLPVAYRYDSLSNVRTPVPLLLGALANTATAVNASGVVAGFTTGGNNAHGFRQAGADDAESIGDLGGGSSAAYGINSTGVVVGYAKDVALHSQAVRYDGTLHMLTSLGGASAQANGINDSGVVVGWSQDTSTPSPRTLATRWVNDTTPQSLGTLGGSMSQAFAVNASGDVVGWSLTTGGAMHAFLWHAGTMTDLNDLLPSGSGWELNWAFALNNTGVIVGDGVFDGVQRAFRLTITPEDDADTTAPVIGWVHVSPDTLWPPNNQMVPVTLTVSASDDSGVAPSCSLVGMASTDPHDGDMLQTGPMAALLRASKTNGGERRYTLTVQCTDAAGNLATANAVVRVPKSANGK